MLRSSGAGADQQTPAAPPRLGRAPLQQRMCGVFILRPRWGLSGRGWLLLALLVLASGAFVFFNIYGFLAITDRVDSDMLVVEGWVHDYAIHAAAAEYRRGHYRKLFTTGGPVIGKGGYINDYNTAASVGAELLQKTGMPASSIQMVPSRVVGRDRTYNSAVALRDWLVTHQIKVTGLNVLTEDAHARRTRLLFQEALGPDVKVGVIAVRSPDYQANRWWRYSDGVREVVGEGIAYVYARFLFRPA